ncbi:MAG: T9SS type A sorting domain-containing protein [Bacteroidetes bacterium]|nr:T9SS type A sorting domain-containing protein [Bacteroidota bacterium]
MTSICNSQVATTTIPDINNTIMNNTSLLFGITFDSRSSLIGKSGVGQIGYYDTNGVVIPAVDSFFHDFPLSTLRYPGNGIGVGFDWKKTIGPKDSRPKQDLLGSQGAPQAVKFGFDEFMAMVESRGTPTSEVQIMVPIYDLSTPGLTPTQARAAIANVISNNADWVEYCNSPNDGSNPGGGIDWASIRAKNGHPTPYNVKIWNIGNEPWSDLEFGSSAVDCNAYISLITPIINEMLAVDPSIKITLPTTGSVTNQQSWVYALLQSNLVAQGKIYALSQHYFPTEKTNGLNPPAQGVAAVSNNLNSLITNASLKKVKIFIGDYAHNISNNPTMAQKDSAMQWLAANLETDFLLMLSQKSNIERANFWTYGNSQAVWHPIRYNSPNNYTFMPAASIYKKLYPFFLNKSIVVNSDSPPASDGNSYSVRSSAFRSENGNLLNIIAVNRDKLNTIVYHPSVDNDYNIEDAIILSAPTPISEFFNENQIKPNVNGEYTLAPMSILIVKYLKNGIQNGPKVTYNTDSQNKVCSNSSKFKLTGGSPVGGVYSGKGVIGDMFDPIVAGVGDITITYTFTDNNGKSGSDSGVIFVLPTPTVTYKSPSQTKFCTDDAPIILTGGNPIGGIYSGKGVENGIFNPKVSGVGEFKVTYFYTDKNGCSNSDSILITVSKPTTSSITLEAVDSYSLNGQTYTQSGVYTQVIQNADGCDSTITLNLTITTTSVTTEQIDGSNVSIYPNPSNGYFILEIRNIDNNSKKRIEIFSILGEKIFVNDLIVSKIEINLQKRQGIYYYYIVDSYEIISKGKLIIN